MPGPTPLTQKTILIGHEDRFVAGYAKRALADAGANIVAMLHSLEELSAHLAGLNRPGHDVFVGDLLYDPATLEMLGRGPPCVAWLFIGDGPLPEHGLPSAILAYPFASYQVVELLEGLFARAHGTAGINSSGTILE